MKTTDLKVMTVRLDEEVIQELDGWLRKLGLRRDNYLRSQLEIEVEALAGIEPNSEIAADFLRLGRPGRSMSRLKVNLKLPENLIARINDVCAEKRVSRDSFIEAFLRFLAHGWPEQGIISPLAKAADYLNDPYRDLIGPANLYRQRCTLTDEHAKLLQSLMEPENSQASVNSSRSKK